MTPEERMDFIVEEIKLLQTRCEGISEKLAETCTELNRLRQAFKDCKCNHGDIIPFPLMLHKKSFEIVPQGEFNIIRVKP